MVKLIINYSNLLEQELEKIAREDYVPRLLLHSCCAPCSSYVIEYLSDYFTIDILYYNPNISPIEEYLKRKNEEIRFINEFNSRVKYRVNIIDCDYENDVYERSIKGLELEPERGARCQICFQLRLEKTAKLAKELGYDFFATTLTVSPYKDSSLINKIGLTLADRYQIRYLASDFKKKNGCKRSIELSNEYGLYRQNFCGCKYSKNQEKDKMKINS